MGVNYLEAAHRTLAHANTLGEPEPRRGTADHLLGLASECALKAVLAALGEIPADTAPPRPYKVHIDRLWTEFAVHVGGRGHATLLLSNENPFAAWRVDHRYEGDEVFDADRLSRHRRGAEEIFEILQNALVEGYFV
jgi:hypothetical protein